MIPAAIVAVGSALAWHDARTSGRVRPGADPFERLMSGRLSGLRVVGGLLLTGAGLVVLAAEGNLRSVPRSAAALGVALAGVAVVLGPYAGRLLADLRSAERERIRTEERAEIAAQLHDSVLQTLALMQRSSGDPRRMVLLARRQERELRLWLYGGGTAGVAAHPRRARARTSPPRSSSTTTCPSTSWSWATARSTTTPARCSPPSARPRSTRPSTPTGTRSRSTSRSGRRRCPRSSATRAAASTRRPCCPTGGASRSRSAAASSAAEARSRLEATPGGGTEWELEVPR